MIHELAKEAGEALAGSPMYRLARGSRERFHTAFLAMLSDEYPSPMSEVWSTLLHETVQIQHGGRSTQERLNMDLRLPLDNGGHIILENKFRSLLRRDQLDRYREKAQPDDYLLALGTSPQFFEPGSNGRLFYPCECESKEERRPWIYADYFQSETKDPCLLESLKDILLPLVADSVRSAYMHAMLLDYIDVLGNLEIIIKSFRDQLDNEERTLGELINVISSQQRVGITDLLKKMLAAELADKIRAGMPEESRPEYRRLQVGHGLSARAKNGVSEVYTALSRRSDPETGDRVAGIQIEGQQYRTFVTGPFGGPDSGHVAAAQGISQRSLWFNPENSVYSAFERRGVKKLPTIYPNPNRKTTYPGFCTYNDARKGWCFLYRHLNVSALSISDIADCAIADMRGLRMHSDEIDGELFS